MKQKVTFHYQGKLHQFVRANLNEMEYDNPTA